MITLQTTDSITLPFESGNLVMCLEQVATDHEAIGAVTVVITTNAHLHELNQNYRGMDRPTDVLSFELGDEHHTEDDLGEIYISYETAERQAIEAGHKLENEIMLLAVHGMLHLLGYEHDTDSGYEEMKLKEKMYLNHLTQTSQPSSMMSEH